MPVPSGMVDINESIKMAGTMLSILPLLIMYLVLQKQFVESNIKIWDFSPCPNIAGMMNALIELISPISV